MYNGRLNAQDHAGKPAILYIAELLYNKRKYAKTAELHALLQPRHPSALNVTASPEGDRIAFSIISTTTYFQKSHSSRGQGSQRHLPFLQWKQQVSC